MSNKLVWPLVVIASAAAMGVATYGNMPVPLRLAAAACFLPFCPGMAIVRFLRIQDGMAEFATAIALSIAIETVVATAMVYSRLWYPSIALAVLIGISVVGVCVQTSGRASPPRESPGSKVSERLDLLCGPPKRGNRGTQH